MEQEREQETVAERFTETTLTLRVLSEQSVEGIDLEVLLRECDEGDCVLASVGFAEKILTGKEMADALSAAGSEPGFFQLDDDGVPLYQDEQ